MHTFTWLSTLLATSLIAVADQEPTALSVAAPVSEVMIYENGARITRRCTVELPAGTTRIRTELFDLPPGYRIGEDDLKVITAGISGEATVRSTRLVEATRTADQARLEALESSLDAVRQDLATAMRLIRNAQADIELLEGWGRMLLEDVEPGLETDTIDVDQLEARFGFISRKRMEILEIQEEAQATNRELLEQAEALENRLATERAGQAVAVAAIEIDSPGGESELSITWLEFLSDWNPELTIHVDTSTGRTVVEMHAEIANRTNTDWNGVTLGLTTANLGGDVPADVEPITVEIIESDEEDADTSPSGPESTEAMLSLNAPDSRQIFTLNQPASLAKGRGKLLVARYETTSQLDLIARPLVETDVWQRATIRNLSDFTFLPGPISLHLDGAFQSIPMLGGMIEPEEGFDIWLARVDDINIERRIIEQETVKTGLLGGGRLSRTRFQIALRNQGTDALTVQVEDRMASTLSDEIEVSLKNVTPPLEPTLGEQPRSGILRWIVDVPPLLIEWTVTVSHSADVETTLIPD